MAGEYESASERICELSVDESIYQLAQFGYAVVTRIVNGEELSLTLTSSLSNLTGRDAAG
jgi:hypothetical protein